MTLSEARAILRGQQSAEMWKVAQAAVIVLDHADGMETRARTLYERADPGERRDAVLENIRSACTFILGEPAPVGLAHRLSERNAP